MVAVGQIFYSLSICLANVSYSNEILLIVFHSCYQQILIPVTEKCHSCDRNCHSCDRKLSFLWPKSVIPVTEIVIPVTEIFSIKKICSYSRINSFFETHVLFISLVSVLNRNPSTVYIGSRLLILCITCFVIVAK